MLYDCIAARVLFSAILAIFQENQHK